MKKIFILLTILCLSCSVQDKSGWENLLDEDLSQWDNYLSFKHQEGYDGTPPKDKAGKLIVPIGLNKDKNDVFQVIKEKEELVLKVSGEIYGCLFTKKSYKNYHFKIKFKWGELKWTPRKKLLKDSGILYHSTGPLGVEHWRTWMLSQEFQIMEGHLGDYWNQANSAIDVKAFIPEYIMNPVADPSQDFISIGENEKIKGFCLRSNNYEKSSGEWNTLELICFENKSIHIVNQEVVMVLQNSRYVKNGESIPLNEGKIQLQSEAAEIFFKDIQIRPIQNLPDQYVKFYED